MEIPRSSGFQLRHMMCEFGQLSRPDGDVTVFQGDTSVTTAVYGPGEVRMNKEILNKATVETVFKPKSGLPGCAEKMFERTLRNTCETFLLAALHPRSSISIIVQEIQDSGSFLSCCVNSCCLALLDASVAMKFLVAAVTCAIDSEECIILDPTVKQEKDSCAVLTFVFENKDDSILAVYTTGSYTVQQFQQCSQTCGEASKAVFDFYRTSIEKKLSKAT
ncbi:exosome complex component RRP46-like isoform X2 [Mizuhopecten yessoensis]|uniref:Exosome complex component RRP46 n=2 Tax=Mizuhopecten yessoensis TaxID=6573 RepID=A0A210QV90_MIZYE|nr:exosome complex component RRP46-like isoform X2 [Mizuhopecten yessoensis]XP_021348868.1 exosome complex component RRP46-like isoform X2 [Mizuhopecten yessoensis]XP_021348869.1 exosome complex component RRP46-like isoform X2 [Mizuhopecten yessoensis]XP_021348870.1 exosome complex component RRP46-like isoform X2 [Mizuhopecten yessoensis]OWF52673.1 Exosome complex component RRP46 [Mizuhopecten yessoensis]